MAKKCQCDETRPICQRCIKSKRACLGYKDVKGFFFRDDTEAVERKAIASQVRATKQASHESSKALVIRQHDDPSSSCSSPQSDIDFISSSLPQCPEDSAVCYFMTNYVMRSRHPETSRGFMEHLLPFYVSSSSNSPLSFATTATALYAHRELIPGTAARSAARARAVANYVEALRLINLAIQDPKEAKSDSLLMAVLLLGLYEVSAGLTICTLSEHLLQRVLMLTCKLANCCNRDFYPLCRTSYARGCCLGQIPRTGPIQIRRLDTTLPSGTNSIGMPKGLDFAYIGGGAYCRLGAALYSKFYT